MDIKVPTFRVIVKPHAKQNAIEGFDTQRNAYLVSIKAEPRDNKANIALVKFLSRELHKKVTIRSGFTGKEKIIETA
ncbi:DUF167 domain-containing protein [Candidatus Woesearchaeota archaeon]|nr:DUF167 domain-containing protein [Candidatus Woesearchaeota archaeon]